MKKYFLHDGKEQQGPFDIEDLKTKNITKETPIWYEGIESWTNVGKIDELSILIKATTPPPFEQKKPVTPPPISEPTKKVELKKEEPKKKSNSGKIVLTILIIGLIALSAMYYNSNNNSGNSHLPGADSYEEKVMTVAEIENADPAKFLEASGTYNENFWGNAMKIHGDITNNATVANYKDVTLEVIFYSETKSEVDRKQYVIYDYFNAHTTKKFELKIERPNGAKTCGWRAISAIPN